MPRMTEKEKEALRNSAFYDDGPLLTESELQELMAETAHLDDPREAFPLEHPKLRSLSEANGESWVFTFGFGHTHPVTGERLANCYTVVAGDISESRNRMEQMFGRKWAFQYPNEEKAGVEKYGLRRVDF